MASGLWASAALSLPLIVSAGWKGGFRAKMMPLNVTMV